MQFDAAQFLKCQGKCWTKQNKKTNSVDMRDSLRFHGKSS